MGGGPLCDQGGCRRLEGRRDEGYCRKARGLRVPRRAQGPHEQARLRELVRGERHRRHGGRREVLVRLQLEHLGHRRGGLHRSRRVQPQGGGARAERQNQEGQLRGRSGRSRGCPRGPDLPDPPPGRQRRCFEGPRKGQGQRLCRDLQEGQEALGHRRPWRSAERRQGRPPERDSQLCGQGRRGDGRVERLQRPPRRRREGGRT
mmetsp:Transcript_5556/g.16866  ORF Transcript_5556/g.16866 Transcript_5556/m.16866 type:complete len:204 (+) Transcript_5556:1130-1741(+)